MTPASRREVRAKLEAEVPRLCADRPVRPRADGSEAVTEAFADGSAVLGPADLRLVVSALADAAAWQRTPAQDCILCRSGMSCRLHSAGESSARAYRALLRRLGGAR